MKQIKSMMVVGLGVLLLSGCSSKAESEFIRGCKQMSDGAVCKCIYGKLEDQYGEEQLITHLSKYMPDEAFKASAIQATLKCSMEQ